MNNNTRSPISKEVAKHTLEEHHRHCQAGFDLLTCECGASSTIMTCNLTGEILVAHGNCDCIAGLVR